MLVKFRRRRFRRQSLPLAPKRLMRWKRKWTLNADIHVERRREKIGAEILAAPTMKPKKRTSFADDFGAVAIRIRRPVWTKRKRRKRKRSAGERRRR